MNPYIQDAWSAPPPSGWRADKTTWERMWMVRSACVGVSLAQRRCGVRAARCRVPYNTRNDADHPSLAHWPHASARECACRYAVGYGVVCNLYIADTGANARYRCVVTTGACRFRRLGIRAGRRGGGPRLRMQLAIELPQTAAACGCPLHGTARYEANTIPRRCRRSLCYGQGTIRRVHHHPPECQLLLRGAGSLYEYTNQLP